MERVRVGVSCEECGGTGGLASERCTACRGIGSTRVRVLSMLEFRELAFGTEAERQDDNHALDVTSATSEVTLAPDAT